MSFRAKTVIGLIIVQGLALVLLVAISLSVLTKASEEAVDKRAKITLQLFASLAKDSVLSYDLATLDSYVEELIKQPELAYIRVMDMTGILLASAGDPDMLREPFQADKSVGQTKGTTFDIGTEIKEGDNSYARIEIGFDTSFINHTKTSAQKKLLPLSIAALLLTTVFTLLLGTQLTRKLNYLVNGAQAMAKGDFHYRVPVYSDDELGKTANAFNYMGGKLSTLYNNLEQENVERKKVEDELRRHKDSLQQTIEKRTEQLERAKNEAESGARAKAAFIANMSHEIRTPMNAIIGFTEVLLLNQDIPTTARKHIEIILNSARGLLTIINDILDISKLESGKFSLESVCFNLPNLIIQSLQTIEQQALEKGLNIQLEINSELPKRYMGDPTRIRQVILNLVSNAIKFTESGSIIVNIEASKKEGFLQISVHDSGIGMTPSQCQKVFDSFSQADASTTRRFGGTGLGTAICKQIVGLMGGEIWVESEYGKGSVFHFTMQAYESSIESDCLYEDGGPSVEEYISPRVFNVLLAEDIKTNADLVTLRLKQQGHSIHWATNGIEVIEALNNASYDIIFMDVMMPDMDGLEATRKIRELEKNTNEHIPILALTASVMQEDHERCRQSGMDMIASKPIDFDELFNTMEKMVPEGEGKLNNTQRIDIWLENEFNFEPIQEIAEVENALVVWRDEKIYIKALLSFVKERSSSAYEIQDLLTKHPDNIKPAKDVAHLLKGLSGNLYLHEVSAIVTDIDLYLKNNDRSSAISFLPELDKILEKTCQLIGKIDLSPLQQTGPIRSFDEKSVSLLIQRLISALSELNPDIVEPLLDELTLYLDSHDLINIKESTENFDFDKASEMTLILANKLNIAIN